MQDTALRLAPRIPEALFFLGRVQALVEGKLLGRWHHLACEAYVQARDLNTRLQRHAEALHAATRAVEALQQVAPQPSTQLAGMYGLGDLLVALMKQRYSEVGASRGWYLRLLAAAEAAYGVARATSAPCREAGQQAQLLRASLSR